MTIRSPSYERWGMGMSFVTAAPEEVQAAARNLEGIRSMLAESSASAAAPTAGVVAAAEDQVSAQVAAFFGAFGQEYQVISAQAQAFHEQFVNLVSAGAGAYLSTELANAEQSLLNAVNWARSRIAGALRCRERRRRWCCRCRRDRRAVPCSRSLAAWVRSSVVGHLWARASTAS